MNRTGKRINFKAKAFPYAIRWIHKINRVLIAFFTKGPAASWKLFFQQGLNILFTERRRNKRAIVHLYTLNGQFLAVNDNNFKRKLRDGCCTCQTSYNTVPIKLIRNYGAKSNLLAPSPLSVIIHFSQMLSV
ncbi:hypothetical protein D3C71_1294010 [compost metagenome]